MKTEQKRPIYPLPELSQYETSKELENYLGSPTNSNNLFCFKNIVAWDEQEAYPEEATNLLEKWDFHHYYIPSAYGGKLESYEEFLSLMRVISRRDLTVAIGHGKTYLGSVGIWVGDDETQKCKLAKIIKEGKQVSLALTEKKHGSDISASDFFAEEVKNGYLLTGEKWLINNATRSKAITIFAKTASELGPRSFSAFLVEKETLDCASYQHLDKIKTHGIRGADISGIRLNQCLVPKASKVGKTGTGLEATLKGFQITRTLCSSLSLGAADTALRVTLDFALSRQLYGDSAFAIPVVQQQLTDAFLDIIICECVAISAARTIHVAPEQMSVWSAVVKYFVPTTVENMIQDLSRVLGARYYLRESYWDGIFQKIVRDNAIISVFDGSTSVNLYAIALSQKHFIKYKAKLEAKQLNKLNNTLENIFSLSQNLPSANLSKLEISNQGYNSNLHSIEETLIKLQYLYKTKKHNLDIIHIAIKYTQRIIILARKINESFEQAKSFNSYKESPEIYVLAKHYCMLHAAISCLNIWLFNQKNMSDFFSKGEWLVLCLERIFSCFDYLQDTSYEDMLFSCKKNLSNELYNLHQENKLFSVISAQLPS